MPLNLVDELWQLISDDDGDCSSEHDKHSIDSGEDLMQISLSAIQGIDCAQTVRLGGYLGNQNIVILLDSGSSSSFLSATLAKQLDQCQPLAKPITIRVANGQLMQCTHELINYPVHIQDHFFNLNLKIIPLQCYDIILGIDWLEQFSPMEIH